MSESEKAQSRPPHTAPPIEGGELPRLTPGVDATIMLAAALFRVAKHPRTDPEWPHLKPRLLEAEAFLTRLLREYPDHDEAGVKLQQVRRFLGKGA